MPNLKVIVSKAMSIESTCNSDSYKLYFIPGMMNCFCLKLKLLLTVNNLSTTYWNRQPGPIYSYAVHFTGVDDIQKIKSHPKHYYVTLHSNNVIMLYNLSSMGISSLVTSLTHLLSIYSFKCIPS